MLELINSSFSHLFMFLINYLYPRYGDTWINVHGKRMHNSPVGQNTSNKLTKPGFYSAMTERFLGSQLFRSAANLDLCTRISSFNEGSTWRTNENGKDEYGSKQKQESWLAQSMQNPTEINSFKMIQQGLHGKTRMASSDNNGTMSHLLGKVGSKRKSLDAELDLNLSLGLESKDEEMDDEHNLDLSLHTTPTSSNFVRKMKEDDIGSESARGASTLDLTL